MFMYQEEAFPQALVFSAQALYGLSFPLCISLQNCNVHGELNLTYFWSHKEQDTPTFL